MFHTKKESNLGFTLMEMLIVVGIIAVLIAIAIPIFDSQTEKAREAYDVHTMRQAASAAEELVIAGVLNANDASRVGLNWWGNPSASNANAWGAYDPVTGKFYPKKTDVEAYGKGTSVDGGTTFVLGNDRGAYGPKEDYTDGIVMIAIYPNGNNKHIDIYWKNRNKNDKYIGGAAGTSDPTYSIRIYT